MDSITAAVFNVVFTSMPILLFAILDRPVKNLNAYIRYPQVGAGVRRRWAACGGAAVLLLLFCRRERLPSYSRAG